MTPWETLIIAVGLAMDAFAVSLGAGAAGRARGARATFRLAFHFGLFQFLMPILGWLAGSRLAGYLSQVDHWIAFALLAWIGGRMVRSGSSSEPDPAAADPSRGWSLIALSVATSIDAFAVGLSLAMLQVTIWQPSVVIGVVAAAFSIIGHRSGGKLGLKFGRRAELGGGLLLVAIGLKILADHFSG